MGQDAQGALIFLVALATLLGAARVLGELARAAGIPLFVGEVVAGVLLGPTVLGRASPQAFSWLIGNPKTETMIGAFTTVGMVLLLVAAGLEVDTSVVRRHAKAAAWTSALAVAIPFAGGAL